MNFEVSLKLKFTTDGNIDLQQLREQINTIIEHTNVINVENYITKRQLGRQLNLYEFKQFCREKQVNSEDLISIHLYVNRQIIIGDTSTSIYMTFKDGVEYSYFQIAIENKQVINKYFSIAEVISDEELEKGYLTGLDILNWFAIDMRLLMQDLNIKIIWGLPHQNNFNYRELSYQKFLQHLNYNFYFGSAYDT